jgi:hypothetical protein
VRAYHYTRNKNAINTRTKATQINTAPRNQHNNTTTNTLIQLQYYQFTHKGNTISKRPKQTIKEIATKQKQTTIRKEGSKQEIIKK